MINFSFSTFTDAESYQLQNLYGTYLKQSLFYI